MAVTFDMEAIDQASDTLDKIRRNSEQLERTLDETADEATGSMQEATRATSKWQSVLAGAAGGAATLLGEKALELAGRLGEMQTQFVANTAALERNATAVGTSVEEYQALQFAFERANLGGDELQEALGTIAERAEDAKSGAQGMIEDFGSIGITVQDLQGLSPSETFQMVARRIGKAETESQALKGATSLLGDSLATELTPRLRENADFFEEMTSRAQETGNVLGEETVDDAQRAQKAWRGLQEQAGGLKNVVMADLAPALEGFSNALGANVEDLRRHKQQLDRNAESARQTGRAWGSAAGQGAKFLDTLSPIAGYLGDATGESLRMLDGATRLAGGLTGLREGFAENNEAARAYIDRLEEMGKSKAQIATSWNDFKAVTAAQQGRFDVLAEEAEELDDVQQDLVETVEAHGVESEETAAALERARKKMNQMEQPTSQWGNALAEVTSRLRGLGKQATNIPGWMVDLSGQLPGAGDKEDGPGGDDDDPDPDPQDTSIYQGGERQIAQQQAKFEEKRLKALKEGNRRRARSFELLKEEVPLRQEIEGIKEDGVVTKDEQVRLQEIQNKLTELQRDHYQEINRLLDEQQRKQQQAEAQRRRKRIQDEINQTLREAIQLEQQGKDVRAATLRFQARKLKLSKQDLSDSKRKFELAKLRASFQKKLAKLSQQEADAKGEIAQSAADVKSQELDRQREIRRETNKTIGAASKLVGVMGEIPAEGSRGAKAVQGLSRALRGAQGTAKAVQSAMQATTAVGALGGGLSALTSIASVIAPLFGGDTDESADAAQRQLNDTVVDASSKNRKRAKEDLSQAFTAALESSQTGAQAGTTTVFQDNVFLEESDRVASRVNEASARGGRTRM